MMPTSRRRALLTLVPAAVLAAATLPAGAHPGGGDAGPPAKLRAAHAKLGQLVAARAEGRDEEREVEADEAEEAMARFEWMNSVSSAPAVSVSARALAAGAASADALPVVAGRWSEITDLPFLNDPVDRGFNFGVGWHRVSGRMTALTTSGDVVYAGAADGGVWRSTDLGRHWTAVNGGLPRLAVGALATNPQDGSVWVGLGEANTNADAQAAFGIYRLAAGSSRWERVGGREAMSRAVYHITFINDTAYAATQQGLLRRASDDLSAPWQVALKPDPNPRHSPYRTSHVTDVVAVPGSGGRRVLAAVGWRGGTLPSDVEFNGFYVSGRSGVPGSFHRVTLKGRINPETLGRTSFSASGGRIYAVVEDTSTVSLLGQGAYVSRSGNPAGPWRLIAGPRKLAGSDSALTPPPGFFPGVQAWYNQYIQADPRDPDHVYLGLEEVYESTDGGRTWTTIGPYWNYGVSCNPSGGTPYECPATTHPDQHAMTFMGNRAFFGNDGGVWRRPTSQHTRGHWANLNATLHTLQYYSAQVGRTRHGLAYWGGLQDNGETLKLPSLNRLEQAFTGDGGDTIVDPDHGQHAVVEYVQLDMYSTRDGGRTYREISPSCTTATFPIEDCDPAPQFIAPFEADDQDIRHWVAGGRFVWETTRGWRTVCEGPGGDPDVDRCDWKKQFDQGEGHSTTAIDVSGDTVYAPWCGPCNRAAGALFRRGISTNAGGTWHQLDVSELPNRYITSVYINPQRSSEAWVTVGSYSRRWVDGGGFGHLWRTTDGGRSWSNVSGNLPDVPAHDVLQFAGGTAVATDVGVFWRQAGSGWSRLGGNLPRTRVWDLAVTPDGDGLVAGTHGRGQWEIAAPSR